MVEAHPAGVPPAHLAELCALFRPSRSRSPCHRGGNKEECGAQLRLLGPGDDMMVSPNPCTPLVAMTMAMVLVPSMLRDCGRPPWARRRARLGPHEDKGSSRWHPPSWSERWSRVLGGGASCLWNPGRTPRLFAISGRSARLRPPLVRGALVGSNRAECEDVVAARVEHPCLRHEQ